MMQKNLSCKNIGEAQKNMITFSFIILFVNMIFLILGAVIYIYSEEKGIVINGTTDSLFPTIALNYLEPIAGIIFFIGLISAAYPSADGALTSLTTSFCIDILGLDEKKITENKKKRIRYITHISFSIIFFLIMVIFKSINKKAIIDEIFTIAGYTYGPLLGLYFIGLFTKIKPCDRHIPFIAIASPLICWIINNNSEKLFNGYKFGFEILLLNAIITAIGLYISVFVKNINRK